MLSGSGFNILSTNSLNAPSPPILFVIISGSNKFGDDTSDHHSFTGSLSVSSSLSVTGSVSVDGSFTTTGDITATGDITVTGQDVQTGANNYLHLGDDSRIVSIGQTNEVNFLYDTN